MSICRVAGFPTLQNHLRIMRRVIYDPDFIDIETPMLQEAQLVVTAGCLRYSSLQTLSANAPNRAA